MYFTPESERRTNTRETDEQSSYYHHFPLIFPQSLFKTWHLPLTTGHYVSAGSFTVRLKINTHYQPHKTCWEKYICCFWSRISSSSVITCLCTDPEPDKRNRFRWNDALEMYSVCHCGAFKELLSFLEKKIINKNHFIMIIWTDLQYKHRSVNTSVWYFTHNIAACQAYHHCCEYTKTCRYFIPKSFIFVSVTLNMTCNPTKVWFSD